MMTLSSMDIVQGAETLLHVEEKYRAFCVADEATALEEKTILSNFGYEVKVSLMAEDNPLTKSGLSYEIRILGKNGGVCNA